MRPRRPRFGITAVRATLGAVLTALALGLPGSGAADTVRVATFNTGLGARGPGLLLRDLVGDGSPRIDAAIAMIVAADPDILALQGIDYDAGNATLGALRDRIAERGLDFPHIFSARPNSGRPTGLDLDGDGRTGGPRDAQGYGRFSGHNGMAILSRHPIRASEVTDLSDLLWRDLPQALDPPFASDDVAAIQRLSSVGHWIVPVDLGSTTLTLLTWSATPPVFDGPEDRNGRRGHDETAVWLRLLEGGLDAPAPDGPLVVLGLANVDPRDGEGRAGAIETMMAHPRLQDPRPMSDGAMAVADPGQAGDPRLDTADFDPPAGNLRVSYLLPDAALRVTGSGVLWPRADDPLAETFGPPEDWPPHRLVWADLVLP